MHSLFFSPPQNTNTNQSNFQLPTVFTAYILNKSWAGLVHRLKIFTLFGPYEQLLLALFLSPYEICHMLSDKWDNIIRFAGNAAH